MNRLPIYLDNCATTKPDPRVLEIMWPFFAEHYGNAASRSHAFGWKAEEVVNEAREQIAGLIGASAREIVLTSGSTESNNLAIKGVARGLRSKGNRIITCVTEHKSVLDTCAKLEREGFEVIYLPVDRFGLISLKALEEALNERTILVSLMLVNNETGTIQPLEDVARLCKSRGVVLHTDATQAAGKLDIDLRKLPVDLLSISAHKMYGPKGIGALYVRRKSRLDIEAQMDGGGHQHGLRSGTLPVPLIVGFGKACQIAREELDRDITHAAELRDRLENGIRRALPHARVNGHPARRSPVVTSISFPGIDPEALLVALKDIAVSSGSACTSASAKPSYVLTAMGLKDDLARSTLRLSVGRFNTVQEIDFAIDCVVSAVTSLESCHTSDEADTLIWKDREPSPNELLVA